MGKIKSDSLKIAVDQVPQETKDGFSVFYTGCLCSLGLVTMMALLFTRVGLEFRLWIIGPYSAAMIFSILLGKHRSKKIWTWIPGLVAVLMMIFFYGQLINGLFTFLNGYREAVSYTYMVYLLPFKTSGNQLLIFQLVLSSFLGYGFTLMVEKERVKAFLFLSLLFIGLMFSIPRAFSMVVFGLWLGFVGLIELRKNFGELGSLKVASYLLILGLFGFSVLVGIFSAEGSQRAQEKLTNIKQQISIQVDEVRYGPKTNLPEGDFSRLKAFKPKEEEVLEIIMEKPDSLYLKGFVGEYFEHNQWKDLAKEKLFEEKDLFYYLNKTGFHGSAQMARLEKELDPKQQNHKMIIKNQSKRQKMIFAPYELVYEPGTKRGNEIAEGKVEFLRGDKKAPYEFSVIPNGVKRYTTIAGELDRKKNQPTLELKEYMNQESHYNQFVYKAYLDLDSKDQEVLENLLGPYEVNEEEHLPYFKVKEKILRSLYDQVYYNEAVEFSSEEGSFLQSFLETHQEGYAVHYATAATLMFRYYGIPARYVEGYLITPHDVDGVLSNAMITLDETHGHAWTEFYQDGVGWIPFETTPPYLEVMEKAEPLNVLPKDFDSRPEKPAREEEETITKDSTRQGLSELIFIKAQEVLPYLGLTLILIGLTYLLSKGLKIFKRRYLLKQELTYLSKEEKKNQVMGLFGHVVKLLTHVKIIDHINDLYVHQGKVLKDHENSWLIEEAFLISQKAKYSSIKITKEEADVVVRAYEKTLESIKSQSSVRQRLNHRFREVLYL